MENANICIKIFQCVIYLIKDISYQGYGVIELSAFSLLHEVNAFL